MSYEPSTIESESTPLVVSPLPGSQQGPHFDSKENSATSSPTAASSRGLTPNRDIYRVEGIGHDFMVGTLDMSVIDEIMEILPGPVPSHGEVTCGNNGTMLRFLTATLSALPGDWRLDGSDRLRQRPLGPLVDALRGLGAEIEYLEQTGFAPLGISGGGLVGGKFEIDARLFQAR